MRNACRLQSANEVLHGVDRRDLLAFSAALAGTASVAAPASAAPTARPFSALGIDASQLGVNPGAPDEQSRVLQRAIDHAAGLRVPLVLGPGVYRVGGLKLPVGAQLLGVRGATRLTLTSGPSILESNGADHITLSGITFDGAGRPIPDGRGLLHLAIGRAVRVQDCEFVAASRSGIVLDTIEGEIRGNLISGAANVGLQSLNARGLTVAGNTLRGCGNNGIQIWRSETGHDGTIVSGNRIEETAARLGGSGQYGNAINVFRAGGVYVGQNRISGAAFSAVRGNAASNLQVIANSCVGCGEVALYAEFGFEGAVIAHNTVDGAAIGVSIANLNEGGRMAVVQGNIIRHLLPRRPAGTDPGDEGGIGIALEADSTVSGNIIDDAPTAGISIGWGHFMRDVSVTGNVVRNAYRGITVSVSPGAGAAVIADNLIANARAGAIVGMDYRKAVTDDLAVASTARFAQLAINGNRVR